MINDWMQRRTKINRWRKNSSGGWIAWGGVSVADADEAGDGDEGDGC